MSIDMETMERMASLAKLQLTQEEAQQLSRELETIVEYMDILSQLPTEQTDPFDQSSEPHNILREDCVHRSMERADLLSNAPDSDGATLAVPKAVE